jgi:ABC-type transport system involved in cytochrome c biogenesis permease subunit
MRSRWPLLFPLAALAAIALSLLPARNRGDFDLVGFGRLPVLADGRLKPLDTVARSALLVLQGRQEVVIPGDRTLEPVAWLLDVCYQPVLADDYRVFRIDNADVLSLFNLRAVDGQDNVRFSFRQLEDNLDELDRQAKMAAAVDASARTAFQRAVVDLRDAVEYYVQLKFSLQPPERPDFAAELADPARVARDRAAWQTLDTYALVRPVPPQSGGATAGWETAGQALLRTPPGGPVDPRMRAFAAIGAAWRAGDAAAFNRLVAKELAWRREHIPAVMRRCAFEGYFDHAEPFYTSLLLYVASFLLAVISWLRWPEELGRAAFRLMGLAFILATAGILARMWIEGRPPVTNLYSSALFIGWGAAGLCLVLERIHRNAVASAAGSLIGFGTLVIAHHLSLSGDTMEMMRAVLDSNFWLSTHVVTVTTGYASTFLAGFLAIIYILRGVFTRSLDSRTADSLARMVYGIVCFATLFSFVGTVLGGIWADQSWGRFWGWDPKENGALMIVLWNAVVLHCRWGGMIRQRGLMMLAVGGNIITSWSWFGTNMLGIGLHSYGFTAAGFYGLIVFVASQLAIIAVGGVPRALWRSPARTA